MSAIHFRPKGSLRIETEGSECIPAFCIGGEPLEIKIEQIPDPDNPLNPCGPSLAPILPLIAKETVVTIRFRGMIGNVAPSKPKNRKK